RWQVPRHRLERLEGHRLARQRGVLLALLRAVVRDGATKAGRGAHGVLVAEPDRVAPPLDLFHPAARFGLHRRVLIHVDSVHSKPGDPHASPGGPPRLSRLRRIVRAPGQVLLRLRYGPAGPRDSVLCDIGKIARPGRAPSGGRGQVTTLSSTG